MSFIKGCQYFFDGFALLLAPGLKRFVIIPIIANMIVFSALFYVLWHFMAEFNHWFASYLPAWLQWLSGVLWLLFFGSFFLAMIYLFVAIANVISAPFNSLLSEKVEIHLTNKPPAAQSTLQQLKGLPSSMARQLSIIGYYIPRALLILILFLVPLIQLVAPVVWFVFSAWMMAITYVDYPTENHQVAMQDVRLWLGQNRALGLGFGLCVLVTSMIPIVNFFAIPAAVAGATKLWLTER